MSDRNLKRDANRYCVKLLSEMLDQLDTRQWCGIPLTSMRLGYYPSDCAQLATALNVSNQALKEAGWYRPDLCNEVFFIWDSYGSSQLCQVNVTEQSFSKPKEGLNTSMPFGWALANYKQPLLHIYVTSSPLDAMVLQARGLETIATYSQGIQKQQIKKLADLNCPVTFIGNTESHTIAAHESAVQSVYPITQCQVCLTDMAFLHTESVDSHIKQHSEDGLKFLIDRILNKKNGESEHQRNISIQSLAYQFPQGTRELIFALAKEQGAKIYPPISDALHLLATLIDADMSLAQAQRLVTKRFGLVITIEKK